jgi:hypothetical protein
MTQVLLLVSVVRATMESGRLEAPFPEVYRRWLAALQKLVSEGGGVGGGGGAAAAGNTDQHRACH